MVRDLAISLRFSLRRSPTLKSISPLAEAGVLDQFGNAFFASSMADFTSSVVAEATEPMTSLVAGLITSNVSSDEDALYSPPTYSFLSSFLLFSSS